MIITVTKQDIQEGQRRDPEQCAIARALVRAGLDHCGVMGPSLMVADRWGRLTSMLLPEAVSDWIFHFDAGNPVSPISFELDVPVGTVRRGRKSQPCPKKSTPEPPLEVTECDPRLLMFCSSSSNFTPRGYKMPKIPKLGGRTRRRSGPTLKIS
jgi:hypothetical protein